MIQVFWFAIGGSIFTRTHTHTVWSTAWRCVFFSLFQSAIQIDPKWDKIIVTICKLCVSYVILFYLSSWVCMRGMLSFLLMFNFPFDICILAFNLVWLPWTNATTQNRTEKREIFTLFIIQQTMPYHHQHTKMLHRATSTIYLKMVFKWKEITSNYV